LQIWPYCLDADFAGLAALQEGGSVLQGHIKICVAALPQLRDHCENSGEGTIGTSDMFDFLSKLPAK
jgi:hypothetical protein